MVKPNFPVVSERQHGMIYLALLLAVALIGGTTAIGLRLAETARIRSAETELLAIGLEFRQALQSYAEATPMGFPVNPTSLDELLRDARSPGIRRHLRRIYPDPFTGKTQWGLVRGLDKRIVGVHSLSKTNTFKKANFPNELESLSGAAHHADWIFSPVTLVPTASTQ